MLYFSKYLLFLLICYFVYNILLFSLKIFIIKRIKQVQANIVINKQVLY